MSRPSDLNFNTDSSEPPPQLNKPPQSYSPSLQHSLLSEVISFIHLFAYLLFLPSGVSGAEQHCLFHRSRRITLKHAWPRVGTHLLEGKKEEMKVGGGKEGGKKRVMG